MFVVPLAQAAPPDIAFWFMLLFVFVGLLNVCLSFPLARRRIKPNSMYGFRTAKTLSNERVWYDANCYAGRLNLAFGVLFALASIVIYLFLGRNFVVYDVACASVLLVGFSLEGILIFRYLRSCDDP